MSPPRRRAHRGGPAVPLRRRAGRPHRRTGDGLGRRAPGGTSSPASTWRRPPPGRRRGRAPPRGERGRRAHELRRCAYRVRLPASRRRSARRSDRPARRTRPRAGAPGGPRTRPRPRRAEQPEPAPTRPGSAPSASRRPPRRDEPAIASSISATRGPTAPRPSPASTCASARRACRRPRTERLGQDHPGAAPGRRPRVAGRRRPLTGRSVEPSTLAEVRRRVGLVFQDPDDQLFLPTVGDDVAFGPRNRPRGPTVDERVADGARRRRPDRPRRPRAPPPLPGRAPPAARPGCWPCIRRSWCSTSPPRTSIRPPAGT